MIGSEVFLTIKRYKLQVEKCVTGYKQNRYRFKTNTLQVASYRLYAERGTGQMLEAQKSHSRAITVLVNL
jgi:hypothetical protein